MPYNPLDKVNLGQSVVRALLECEPVPMEGLQEFQGAGVYAIYYVGSASPYGPFEELNRPECQLPIYVGKAIPKGARKGNLQLDASTGAALRNRIGKHASSISAVPSLELADFRVRYLVLDDIWIPLGESLLIREFHPLWNTVVEGFGNNDPGKGRYSGARPVWDELHPGREWAAKCQAAKTERDEIENQVREYLADRTSS